MSENNEESQCQGHVPIADLRKLLEGLRPTNGGVSASVVGESPTPTGADLTNLLLIDC